MRGYAQNSYLKIINSELDILDKLDRSDYPIVDNLTEDLMFDRYGRMMYKSTNLPIENDKNINENLGKYKDNLFYDTILYYRNVLKSQGKDITLRISEDVVRNYGDVLGINESFCAEPLTSQSDVQIYNEKEKLFKENFLKIPKFNTNIYCFVITDNQGLYYGSVWVFTHPDYPYIGMYGIKRSLLDHLTRSKLNEFRGVSRLLINKITEYGRDKGLNEIIVVNSLETMIPILNKYGFTEYENDDDTSPERKFINPISLAYTYFAKDI